MRIAYVATMVPRRRELASGPIDAEWIVDERGPADVVVFVDYESDGSDLLRQAGITVHVSAKRTVLLGGDEYETAEELSARLLARLHAEAPFDVILYDSAQTTDWAWHQPRLGSIPRGIALGAGPIRDIRLVANSPALFRTHGRRMWASTGTLASADFLLSDAAVDAYGLDPAGLPPRYSLTGLPTTPPPEGPARLLALVALSEGPAGLASVVTEAQAQVETNENTIFAIIHPDIASGPETTRDIVLAGLAPHLRDRVRVAEPSSDGVADGLLAQADVVVAARSSDLAVPAVADAAGKVGYVVLKGSDPAAPRLTDAVIGKAGHAPAVLVPVDGPLLDLVPLIDELVDEAPAIVLHMRSAAGLARRLWRLPGASCAGLVMVCDTGPYLGQADPDRPTLSILGFGMEDWPSIRRLLMTAPTLHHLIEASASLADAHRTNLLAVPALGVSEGRLRSETPDLPAWTTDTGSLPPPDLSGLSDPDALTSDGEPDSSVKQWAENHGFWDRIRLALPWKWGLLNRAMRDRW